MAAFNRLWSPAKVLRLGKYSPEEESTCIGHAPSKGRRCRNPIAAVNHEEAAKMLDRISRIDVLAADLEEEFEDIASLLLCRRWHQNQASIVARKWCVAVETYRAKVARQRTREQISVPATEATTRTRSGMVTVASMSTNTTRPIRPQPSTSSRAVTPPTPSPLHQSTRRQLPHEISPSLPVPERLERPVTPPLSAEPTLISETSSEAHHHARTSNITADAECAICFEDISSEDSKVLRCKHQFHNSCVSIWFATQDSSARSRTCPYCRAALIF